MHKKAHFDFSHPFAAVPAWFWLFLLGCISLLIYWVGLVLPYNMLTLHLKPALDIAKLTVYKPVAQVEYVMVIMAQIGVYILALRLCRPGEAHASRSMWLVLGAILILMAISIIWLYPIGALDVFDYIMEGRIFTVHGGNPFALAPRIFPKDPFRYYVGWADFTSAYGPLWELLAAGVSRLAGNGILANVVGFKLVNLFFFAGSTLLIALILKRVAPQHAIHGVILFAWNPLTIYEVFGNAHNDIAMVFFILLGLYAFLRGGLVWTMLALTAGGLIKFIPFMLLPLAYIAGLRLLPALRSRVRFTCISGIACVALSLSASLPFLNSWKQLKLMPTRNLFTTSLPALIQARLQILLGTRTSQMIVMDAVYVFIGVVLLIQMRRIWVELSSRGKLNHPRQENPPESFKEWWILVRAIITLLLFYLIFACAWFQPWYALWPLALAALLPEGSLVWTALLLAFVSMWKTPLFSFILFPGNGYLPPATYRETILGPATLGLVWLYLAARAIYDQVAPRS